MNFLKLENNTSISKKRVLCWFYYFLTMCVHSWCVNGFILADAGLPMDAVITATALITILQHFFQHYGQIHQLLYECRNGNQWLTSLMV